MLTSSAECCSLRPARELDIMFTYFYFFYFLEQSAMPCGGVLFFSFFFSLLTIKKTPSSEKAVKQIFPACRKQFACSDFPVLNNITSLNITVSD